MSRFWIGITVLIVLSFPTLVQCDETTFETWIDITTTYEFADRWRYDGDQGIRGVLSGSDFTLLYVRPSVRYRINPWFTVHGGIRFFQTFFEDDADTFEVGPWQGLRFVWPRFKGYAVSHYLRLEERMIWSRGQESDFDFTLRSRYQLGVRTPDFNILFKNGVYMTASIELFWNLEDGFFDNFVNRLRYEVGAGTKVSDAWRAELHYTFQNGRAIDQTSFATDEHILRVRLFYQF